MHNFWFFFPVFVGSHFACHFLVLLCTSFAVVVVQQQLFWRSLASLHNTLIYVLFNSDCILCYILFPLASAVWQWLEILAPLFNTLIYVLFNSDYIFCFILLALSCVLHSAVVIGDAQSLLDTLIYVLHIFWYSMMFSFSFNANNVQEEVTLVLFWTLWHWCWFLSECFGGLEFCYDKCGP